MKKSQLVNLIKEGLRKHSIKEVETLDFALEPQPDDNAIDQVATDNPVDMVTLDIPLFIRLLEYAKEDAQTDMDLHFVAEKAIELGSVQGVALSMEDYENLVPQTDEVEEGDGLWANIRAKRARGEKPAHKNSKAHKDAVAAGKKINAMNEDKADAVRWFGNLKQYYQKGLTSPDLKDPADKQEYKRLAKDFFSKL